MFFLNIVIFLFLIFTGKKIYSFPKLQNRLRTLLLRFLSKDHEEKSVPHLLQQTLDGSWTLCHQKHQESFHSQSGARFEAEKLYIEGSKLKEALKAPHSAKKIKILDIGLGLGYNACASLAAWQESGQKAFCEMISLEEDLDLFKSLISKECPWQKDWSAQWKVWTRSLKAKSEFSYEAFFTSPQGGSFTWKVLLGDARKILDESVEKDFSFIWQDAFSPSHNPRLWSKEWFSLLRKKSLPGCKLLSYSVSRLVKDNLTEALWSYEKIKAPGKKKHWLLAKCGKH